MQSTATPEADRTPEAVPAIRHTVPWRLTSVTALPDARLRVSFIDGTIFEPLRDPAVFAQARVVLGAVQWPNGADLAPDAMYDAIRDPGVWVLD